MEVSEEIVSLEFPGDPTKLASSREVPVGTIEFEVKEFRKGKTSEATKEKVKVTVILQAAAPEEYRGVMFFHDVVIGSEADPQAREKATWDRNAHSLIQLLKESGVVFTPNTRLVEAFGAAIGQHVMAKVGIKPGNTDKQGRKWEDRKVIRSFHRVGSMPASVRSDNEMEVHVASAPAVEYANND